MRYPTIRDVAREARVGIGTVSRVLNNNDHVSDETRERVMAAIHSLGFRPNKIARQLSRGLRIPQVGVVLPFVSDHSFVERLRGAQLALHDHGDDYELVLYNVSSPQRYDAQLTAITQQGLVEALLIISLNLSEDQRDLMNDAGVLFVNLNDRCREDFPCIGLDNIRGGRLATEHLIQLGHRRIAYIGDSFPNPYGFATSEDRFSGYRLGLDAHGIPFREEYTRFGPYGRETAYALTNELLQLPEPPTAIFAMTDVQALGCVAAVRESGRDVPHDISVIGFDDVEIAQFTGLTTVRQHLELSGLLGIRYLLQRLDGETAPPPALPDFEIVARQTTGALRP
jgi:LacI family transcriptional regulator